MNGQRWKSLLLLAGGIWMFFAVLSQPARAAVDTWCSHITGAYGWKTTIAFYNPGLTPSTATVYRFNSDGTSFGNALTITVPPLAWASIPANDLSYNGTARFTSQANLEVKLTYQMGNLPSVCEFMLTGELSSEWMLPNAVRPWMDYTGIALMNQDTVPVDVILEAWQEGSLMDTATVSVASGRQLVRLSEGFWPGLAYPDFDTVRIRSSRPIPAPIDLTGNQAQDRHLFFTARPVPGISRYFGQTPPGNTPVLFGPADIRSNSDWFWHGAPVFSPDGREFYLDVYCPRTNPAGARIMQKLCTNGVWGPVQNSWVTGNMEAAGISLLTAGNKAFWMSYQPEGCYWTAERNNGLWSTPTHLDIPLTADLSPGWRLSVARSGRIYTHLFRGNQCDLYTIEVDNGQYAIPQRMSNVINSAAMEIGVFVDPDEEYIIFESDRPGGSGQSDLYISFQRPDHSWTDARNMGPAVNSAALEGSPYVSPDKRYLFFLSERGISREPYWAGSDIISTLKQEALR